MKFLLFSQYRTMNETKSDLCSKLSGGNVEIAFSASRGIFSWKSFFSLKDFCLIHFRLWAKKIRPFDVNFSVGWVKLFYVFRGTTWRAIFRREIFFVYFGPWSKQNRPYGKSSRQARQNWNKPHPRFTQPELCFRKSFFNQFRDLNE